MDQYLKAIDMFDSENTRFWTRFNLFIGFQFILIAGFVSGYDKIKDIPKIGILLIIAGITFSIFNFLVVRRSLFILHAIAQLIDALEKNNDDFVLLKYYKIYSKNELGGILKLCIGVSLILILFWIVFFYLYISMI